MSRQGTRVTDTKKVSGELFSLTYGALVSQIVKDYQNVEDVNKQLEKMGYNIGVRIIEDFLARTKEGKCTDFRDTVHIRWCLLVLLQKCFMELTHFLGLYGLWFLADIF